MKMFWRIVLGLAAVFLIFYLITQPEAAADGVQRILDFFASLFDSITRFFGRLST